MSAHTYRTLRRFNPPLLYLFSSCTLLSPFKLTLIWCIPYKETNNPPASPFSIYLFPLTLPPSPLSHMHKPCSCLFPFHPYRFETAVLYICRLSSGPCINKIRKIVTMVTGTFASQPDDLYNVSIHALSLLFQADWNCNIIIGSFQHQRMKVRSRLLIN